MNGSAIHRSSAPMIVFSSVILSIWLVVGAANPAQAQAPERTFWAGQGEHALVFEQRADQTITVSGAFGSVALSVPDDAYLTSVATAGDRWYLAGIIEGAGIPRLTVRRGRADTVALLAAPATEGGMLMGPVWAADRDTARTLVWLEGDRHDALAVRAARFDGEAFGPSETVASPGPGTQIAVTAAVLADGDTLVAWAAYDGQDDEILWSRRGDGGWSPPARVEDDDSLPDITPSLRVVEGGALLTWSAYDGNDYRVMVARFEHGGWSAARTIGERGSVLPTLAGSSERPFIVYKTAVPRSWSVLALDVDGQPWAKASMPLGTNHRPRLEPSADGTQVTLSWPAVADRVPPAKLALGPVGVSD